VNFFGKLKRATEWLLNSKDPELLRLFGAQPTYAGVDVSETTALNLTTVYSCIDLMASTIASLPLNVYRRTKDGKERLPEHPLYTMLHDRVNPFMTSFSFRQAAVGHLLGWGNSYSEIQFGGRGEPIALWLLRPDKMQIVREADLSLTYHYSLPDGSTAKLPSDRILHLHGLSFDGVVGYSPVQKARETLGLAMASLQYGAALFANNANPGTILKMPGKLGPERAKEVAMSWDATHSGLSNAHRTSVLEGGADITTIGINPEDAQFLETRKFEREEIASIFRIPPHLVGDLDHATFSNIENLAIQFCTYTLRPWLVNIEQQLLPLFSERERQSHFAEFVMDGLLRGDTTSRHAAYATGRQWGYLSVNDIRGLENLNGIGKAGDRYLEPANMTAVPEAPRSLLLPVVSDVMEGIRKREKHDVLTEGRKALESSGVAGFARWLHEYCAASLGKVLAERLAAPITAHLRAAGEGKDVDPSVGSAFAAVQARNYMESEESVLLGVVDKALDEMIEPTHALEVWYAERSQNSPASIAAEILRTIDAQLEGCHGQD
jgi:HK97 family phage portal protein